MANLVRPGVTKRANIHIWEAETFCMSNLAWKKYHQNHFFLCINYLIKLIGQKPKQY